MITKRKICYGIKEHLIRFDVDPNMGSGTVCRIGDQWFYFGGLEAEEMDPEEYIANVPISDIIDEIYDVLDDFSKDEDLKDEYDYYDVVLTYRNGFSQ